ncbi:hypothetical protein WJX77_008725 [Trebouxia sp. C0004]
MLSLPLAFFHNARSFAVERPPQATHSPPCYKPARGIASIVRKALQYPHGRCCCPCIREAGECASGFRSAAEHIYGSPC